MAATANAFALLALRDNEDPNEALDRNVREMSTKKAKAAEAPKPKAAAAPAAKPAGNKKRDDKPRGERRNNDRQGQDRGSDRPARRERSDKPRQRRDSGQEGGRAPRREHDRKSGSGRRPQDNKSREDSKLNLGKQAESEAEAKLDAREDATPEEQAEETPAEPEVVTQTLAEYKASLASTKAGAARKAGDGEDAKWKGEVVKRDDNVAYAPKSKKARKAAAGNAKASEAAKKDDVKTLKANFKFDNENDRPRRNNNQKGDKKGATGRRAPDLKNAAAFPSLS